MLNGLSKIFSRSLLLLLLFGLMGVAFSTINLAPAQAQVVCTVSGLAYYDYDLDTTQNGNPAYTENGLYNATVTVYYVNAGGVDATLTTTTDGAGNYSITIPDLSVTAQVVRIEFTDFAFFARSGRYGAGGTGSGTTTDFVDCSGGVGTSNLAVGSTEAYCQYRDDPHIVTSCFTEGPQGAGVPALVSFAYDSGLDPNVFGNVNESGGTSIRTQIGHVDTALDTQLGAVIGIAHSRVRNIVYSASFMKLRVDFGPTQNPGTIYLTDLTGVVANATPLTTLIAAGPGETIADWHPELVLAAGPPTETSAWDYVGKRGLGDIDISPSDNVIYAWNLWDKNLYALELNAAGTAVISTTTYPMPQPAAFGATRDCLLDGGTPLTGAESAALYPNFNNPADSNVDLRPGGIKAYGDRLFVGVTCTAESMSLDNPGAADTPPYGAVGYELELAAYVFEYLIDTTANQTLTGPTLVAEIPLDFERGCVRQFPIACHDANWRPWQPRYASTFHDYTATGDGEQFVFPQPWLSDIELDEDGFMVVTFTDRLGHTAIDNPGEITSAGDAYMLAPPATPPTAGVASPAFSYTLESNGDLAHGSGARANSGNAPDVAPVPGTTRGPGGEAFFWEDYYAFNAAPNVLDFHQQLIQGSAGIVQGKGEVVMASMDPAHCDSRFGGPACGAIGNGVNSGGLIWMSNQDGSRQNSVELFEATTTGGFAKAIGIGDVEFVCSPQPLEIGNRVWYDPDLDGVQDPNEVGIPGVTVSLYVDSDNDGVADLLVAQMLTNADGEYIFNENITGAPTPFTMTFTSGNTAGQTFLDINGNGTRHGGATTGADFGQFSAFEPQGILANTIYEVRLDNVADFQPGGPVHVAVGNVQPFESPTFNDTTANGTIRDDNGVQQGGALLGFPGVQVVAFVNTANWGDNDHTFDFGFFGTPPTPTPTPTTPPGVAGPAGTPGPGGSGTSSGVGDIPDFLLGVTELPATGETPIWRNLFIGALVGIVTIIATGVAWQRRRKRIFNP